MGIPALWDLLKEQDHSFHMAQLAEEHYRTHGRPLRIAVDEADWRFNNLTTQQVYIIREKSDQPAYQGIEKSMFYRICKLLTLNIQLLFVFDGPRRPAKRGKNGGSRIDYEKLKLLKEMLRYFRIPYHEAPGEAEAECARLQTLGVVDAVFSQDSDSLMFGCDFLIRDDRKAKEKDNTNRSKDNTQKNAKSVKVIRGHDIRAAHNFDREGLVLFAMLCGGDYDVKGLEKCGPALATQAIKQGLGKSLCRCETKADCQNWREELVSWMPRRYTGFVPFEYPEIKTLKKYNRPTISTDEQLLNLRGLRNGWNQPMQELKLLELTATRFNIWGRLYMNWVGPVLLTRYLSDRDASLPRENAHAIKLTKRRVLKADQPIDKPLERKLTFSPFGVTTLAKKDFEGDRMGYWTSVSDEPFDPEYRVEWEMPSFLLQKVLPLDVLDPPLAESKKAQKKRKQPAGADQEDVDQSNTAKKRKRKSAKDGEPSDTVTPSRIRKELVIATPKSMPTGRASHLTLHREPPQNFKADFIDLLSDDDGEDSDPLEELDFYNARALSAPKIPIPTRRTLTPLPRRRTASVVHTGHVQSSPQSAPIPSNPPARSPASSVIDLIGDYEDSDSDSDEVRFAIERSLTEAHSSELRPDFTSSVPKQRPSDGAMRLDVRRKDHKFSPVPVGTRSLPVIPARPVSCVQPPELTPQRKSSSRPSIDASAAPPNAMAEHWSFSSPHTASMNWPRPTTSRPVSNMQGLDTMQSSPVMSKRTLNMPHRHLESVNDAIVEEDQSDMTHIRAARLRHFQNHATNSSIVRASHDLAATSTFDSQDTPKAILLNKDVVGTKIANIECIDLTGD